MFTEKTQKKAGYIMERKLEDTGDEKNETDGNRVIGSDSPDGVRMRKKDGFGATQKTYFFSYKVDSAYVCSEYEGYTPEAGNQLLVASVTLKNTFGEEIEMYDTDFQAQWGGSGEDDFSLPITFNGTEEGLATLTQEQLPGVYTMAKGESRTGLLIFEVPDGYQDFSISYMEAFDDDSTGDTFFVNFTAETR